MQSSKKFWLAIAIGSFMFFACKKATDSETGAPAPAPEQSTTPQVDHKQQITDWYNKYLNEIWNKGDFRYADGYWGSDVKNAFEPHLDHGPAAMQKQVEEFSKAFSDLHFELKDIMVEGDKMAAWVEITGTHTGEIFGIPATGKHVTFREAAWYTLKEGKFDEVYPFVDWQSFFDQIGQYPKTVAAK